MNRKKTAMEINCILVASNEQDAFHVVQSCLGNEYNVIWVTSLDECVDQFKKRRFVFTFLDIRLLMKDGLLVSNYSESLKPFWQAFPTADIFIITPHELIREAVYAVKAGAIDYVSLPPTSDEIKYVTERTIQQTRAQQELDYLRDQFWEQELKDYVHTKSPLMRKVFEKVRSVAPTKTTILLTGETGTGKGVFAKIIHANSNRRDKPFISLHCGAIPETLIESELFGHEKGSFTGADRRKPGKFEIAHEGTLFLDEIGTISPNAQIKLLQVLQDRTFQRVGGQEIIECDNRYIAATNIDLKSMVDNDHFRKDLYYRLNVFPINIPSLRQRMEDIPLLVDYFLNYLNQFYTKEIYGVHPLVIEAFNNYEWPGNIRELENIMERAYILESSSVITPESIPGELLTDEIQVAQVHVHPSRPLADIRRNAIEKVEREYLKEILSANNGKINLSAKAAGISTRQLHKLLTRYAIQKKDYK